MGCWAVRLWRLLTRMELSGEEMEALGRYVDRGGRLVAFRPPAALAGLFGCSEVRGVGRCVYSGVRGVLWWWTGRILRRVGFRRAGCSFVGMRSFICRRRRIGLRRFCTEPEGLLPFAGVSLWYRGRGRDGVVCV